MILRVLLLILFALTSLSSAQIHGPIASSPSREVARLRVQIPDRATFQVWGTIPLPPGTAASASSPFTIEDQLGRARKTQAEVVRWHADGTVAVLELVASVERGELEPGSWAEFKITDQAQPWSGLPHVAASSAALAASEGSAYLRATDLEGHVYRAALGRSLYAPSSRVFRWGPCKATARIHSWLAAYDDPAAGPPVGRLYPFLGSATAYWTAVDGSDVLELDLQFANASGAPLETLWIESLELVLPAKFAARSYAADPYFGPITVEGDRTIVELARPEPDGKLHALRWGQRHAWRLAVYPRGDELEAGEILAKRGWGLVVDGENEQGERLQSWASIGILPQTVPAPDLSAIAGVGEDHVAKWQAAREALAQGSTFEFPDGTAPRLGAFFHSYGSAYGGMTGGGHVWPTAAALYAWADRRPDRGPQPEAMLYLQALAGMNLDRQRGILMGGDGFPLSAAAIMPADKTKPPSWRRYRSPGNPTWNDQAWPAMRWGRDFDWIKGDPFGQDAMPHPATDLAFELGRVPDWYWNSAADEPGPLWAWASIDYQHGIRFLWPLQTLVELTGDFMAREWIHGEAQIARLERHVAGESHLHDLLEDAATRPGIGSAHAGRGDAHAFNLWAYAYSLARPGARDHWRAELRDVVEALTAIQTPFGVWTVAEAGKVVTVPPMNGNERVAQSIESSFIAHALRGLDRAVFEGVDEIASNSIDNALALHAFGVATWGWQDGGNYFRATVGPLDGSSLYLEGPRVVDGIDRTTIFEPLAYGLQVADYDQEQAILAALRELVGAQAGAPLDVVARAALGTKLSNVASKAGAIGVLQELAR